MKRESKTLKFGEKSIYFLAKDGAYWIAIKPICEALGVNYNEQFRRLKNDSILCELLRNSAIVAADGKLRKMVCLPEKYIYGWIFSLQSGSEELKKYKQECYEVLYNHFHGSLTQREAYLKTLSKVDSQIIEIEKEMLRDQRMIELNDLKNQRKQARAKLTRLDNNLMKVQQELEA